MWLIILLSVLWSSSLNDLNVLSPGDVIIYDFDYKSKTDFKITLDFKPKELYVDYLLIIKNNGEREKIYNNKPIIIKKSGNIPSTFSIVMKVKSKSFTYPRPITSTNLILKTNYFGKFKIFTYNNRDRVKIGDRSTFVTHDYKNNKNLVNLHVNY